MRRFINDQETRQVYGLGGELLAEYAASTSPTTLQKEYGYRNGQLLITAAPGAGSSVSIRPQLEPDGVTSGLSADLLARINKAELPPWVRGFLSTGTGAEYISDTSTPLYGPRFPYASLNSSVLPVMPQSMTTRIVFASNRDGTAQLYSMNTDGSGTLRLTNDAANDESPRWSPNGSRIVFQSDRDNVFSGMADIYVMNADGSGQTRLTSDANDDRAPVWSPDGTKIAFQSARSGVNYQVYVMNADGSGQVNISNGTTNDTQPSWSPDGTKIAFASDRDQAGFSSIYVMNANGSGQTRLTFSGSGWRDEQPAWSPDGMKLAFSTTRDSTVVTWNEWIGDGSGQSIVKSKLLVNKEVYLMNTDGSAQVRLTSTQGSDDSPGWSTDGTRIAFRSDRDRTCCDPTNQVWVMNADGSNQVDLSNNGFGDYNPNWSSLIPIPQPPNGAQFISQSVPQAMTAGQSYSVSVTMKNTGSNTWTTASHHNLGSQNAQDNTTWGMARVGLPSSVAPGSQATFNFTVTAPATSGTYNFQWRMVQDGVEWFGDLTPNVVVTVSAQSGGNPSPNPEPDPGTPIADVRWIVTDQLGTPRMIFDQSGSLANVSRHDYLPFGEELVNVGGRTTTQGYTGDSTRQKFTQKERDNETGLDYFGARYYANAQGRFTSTDPSVASGRPALPQSWNRYSYVRNKPLSLIDRTGMEDQDPKIRGPEAVVPEGDPRATDPNCAAVQYTAPTSVATKEPITTSSTPAITSFQERLAQAVQAPSPSQPTAANVNAQAASSPPDFKSLEIGTGKIGVGLSFSATRDRSGNWYFGVKPNLGITLFPVTASFVTGFAFDSDGQAATNPSSVRSAISGVSLAGDVTLPSTDVIGLSSNTTPMNLGVVPMGPVILPGAGGTITTGHGINIPGSASAGVNFVFHIPFTGP